MKVKTINIAKDYSESPSGRHPVDGEYNGETFRDYLLIPALQEADRVCVEIDGPLGYPSSFSEEAFGGLIRAGVKLEDVKKKLKIIFKHEKYKLYHDNIWRYIESAHDKML